jgi:proteic killer suppression protein
MTISEVQLSKKAEKQVEKLPKHILLKLIAWIEDVGNNGIYEVRKIPSFHDEPLKGKRKGQRSIRLSKQYRAIYEINECNKLILIFILEVNKHEY